MAGGSRPYSEGANTRIRKRKRTRKRKKQKEKRGTHRFALSALILPSGLRGKGETKTGSQGVKEKQLIQKLKLILSP